MLGPSKLLKRLKMTATPIFIVICHACTADTNELSFRDLQNPEALIQKLQSNISESRRRTAGELYQSAVQRKEIKNNWGASAKYFAESALAYPTAKALIGLAESEAYLAQTADHKALIAALKVIRNYLNSAAAVDERQKQLSQAERDALKREIQCIDDVVSSERLSPGCKYVEIIRVQQ